MADQIELQKIHHCLRIIENIKKQIGNEDAVCYVEKAMDLTRKWLNDKTDVSQKLYNLLDDEDTYSRLIAGYEKCMKQ